jgi:hypothetical protein
MSRAPGEQITKDPGSIEPYGFDWTDWLDELGATISQSTYAVTLAEIPRRGQRGSYVREVPSALTLTGSSIVTGSKQTQTKLVGGSLNGKYTVTNHVVTSTGDEDERSFVVLVQNR